MKSLSTRIFLSSGSQAVGRILTSALGLISIALVTRYLGPDLYGELTAAVLYISIFITLADAGITTIAIREISQKKRDAASIIGNILSMRFAISSLLAACAIILSALFYGGGSYDSTRLIIGILSLTILLTAIQSSLSAILSAQIKNYFLVVGDILNKFAAIGGILLVIHLDAGILGITFAYLAGAALSFISDSLFSLMTVRPKLSFDTPYIRRVLALSLPVGLALILNTLYFRVDGIMLSLMKGPAEVGLYGIAYKIVELTMSFALFFGLAIFPLMSRLAKDSEKLALVTRKSLQMVGLVAAPITIGVIVLSQEAIFLLGGEAYLAAALPLSILMVANYFIYLNIPYLQALLATNHQNRIVQVNGTLLGVNILLNLILIPPYGTVGAAISVVLAEACSFGLLRHFYRKDIAPPKATYEQLFFLSFALLMGAVILLIKPFLADLPTHLPLLTGTLVGALTYLLLVLIFGYGKRLNPRTLFDEV